MPTRPISPYRVADARERLRLLQRNSKQRRRERDRVAGGPGPVRQPPPRTSSPRAVVFPRRPEAHSPDTAPCSRPCFRVTAVPSSSDEERGLARESSDPYLTRHGRVESDRDSGSDVEMPELARTMTDEELWDLDIDAGPWLSSPATSFEPTPTTSPKLGSLPTATEAGREELRTTRPTSGSTPTPYRIPTPPSFSTVDSVGGEPTGVTPSVDLCDAATATEEDFAPRLPGGMDHITIANLVLHSPAASADVLSHLLTPRPALQVEQETIRLAVRTAVEVERQVIHELAVGINGSLASGGAPAAYEWFRHFCATRSARPRDMN